MRILLVNPASDSAFSRVGFTVPPLGLAYIGAALRDAGHEVKIHDLAIEKEKPDYSAFGLVGISGDTFRHGKALSIARDAKAAGAKVMIGGPHVTFMDEEAASEPCIDFVVRGEGEETAVALVDALEKGEAVSGVDGITYMNKGGIVRTPDRAPPGDLDALPFPARDLLRMGPYRRLRMAGRQTTSIVSSRGCPGGCRFCCSPLLSGRKWRARSVDSLMSEIRLIVGVYGFEGVAFVDDNFTLDPRRVIELSKAIVSEGLDIRWWCFSRVDTVVKNPEMVSWMGKSGCRYVFMGVESPNQATLDTYSKKISPDLAKEAVKLLKKNGIETLAAYILGAPDETREMIEETIRFSIKLDTGGVQYTLLTPYPGTDLLKEMEGRLLTRDWDRFDCVHPVIRSDHLSPEELQGMLFKAYKSFYMRPKRILISMLSALRGRGVKIKEIKGLIENLRKG